MGDVFINPLCFPFNIEMSLGRNVFGEVVSLVPIVVGTLFHRSTLGTVLRTFPV